MTEICVLRYDSHSSICGCGGFIFREMLNIYGRIFFVSVVKQMVVIEAELHDRPCFTKKVLKRVVI